MNGLPNDMAKNGQLVIRDFYEDSKFWRKWQIWEEYMKGLIKIQMRWQKKATLTMTDFSKRANFCQKWWIRRRLIKCLAKTHKWVDKKKACENLGTSWDWTSVVPLCWWNDREISDNWLDIVIKKKQSIFIVVDEDISSDWNTSINASRWN